MAVAGELEHVAGDESGGCPVLALMRRTDAPDCLLVYHVTACLRCAAMIDPDTAPLPAARLPSP